MNLPDFRDALPDALEALAELMRKIAQPSELAVYPSRSKTTTATGTVTGSPHTQS